MSKKLNTVQERRSKSILNRLERSIEDVVKHRKGELKLKNAFEIIDEL